MYMRMMMILLDLDCKQRKATKGLNRPNRVPHALKLMSRDAPMGLVLSESSIDCGVKVPRWGNNRRVRSRTP